MKLINNQVRNHLYQYFFALFIDLSKVFHTVDRKILLEFLKKFGLDQNNLVIVSNIGCCGWWLTVRVKDCIQSCAPGINLGFLLFTIFINELGEKIANSKNHLYADNAILYIMAPSVGQAIQNVQKTVSLQHTLHNLWSLLNFDFFLFFQIKGLKRISPDRWVSNCCVHLQWFPFPF